jgi:uncharacterized protein YdeI (YjbR/CyaY-like superfamily)
MKTISGGTAHQIPTDFKSALVAKPKAHAAWESLTPLARNEWICWVISVKQQETRDEHIKRAVIELIDGERRPCCWVGCIHRKDKPMSASQKFVLSRSAKK